MGRALVIEGGGMRAAFANGVLSAFEEHGFRPWDAMYGTSAGGALAAWASAGQARFAEGTWRYAADPRILRYRRGLRGGPILDHAALLDIVYQKEHPLDVDAVRKAPWPVIVTAADVDAGTCTYQDLREGDVIAWLEATGRLPFAAGPPVAIDGRRYLDGGVLDPIPVKRAVEDGHDHVTVLLSTPHGPPRRDARILATLSARRYPALRDGLLEHQQRKDAAIAYALDPPAGVQVDVIRPEAPTGIHRLSRDLAAIDRAIETGRRQGRAFVGAIPAR